MRRRRGRAIAPPAWSDALPAVRQFFLSNSQITIDWLAAQSLACTEIAVTENCGSTALELARHLGCAPIYLFGLDLAIDAGNPARRLAWFRECLMVGGHVPVPA